MQDDQEIEIRESYTKIYNGSTINAYVRSSRQEVSLLSWFR